MVRAVDVNIVDKVVDTLFVVALNAFPRLLNIFNHLIVFRRDVLLLVSSSIGRRRLVFVVSMLIK